jgi:hypothetical protein
MNPFIIVVIASGGFLVVLALVILVLHSLGKSMDPNHVLVCRVQINQSPEAVFTLLADAHGWPKWDPGVKRVESLPPIDGKPACRMMIGHNAMDLVTSREEPPRVLERIILETGKRPMFSGTWRHDLSPAQAGASPGCVVTLTENGKIHIPFARVMARKFADPAMYLKRHLKRLAAHFGENPTIEVVTSI